MSFLARAVAPIAVAAAVFAVCAESHAAAGGAVASALEVFEGVTLVTDPTSETQLVTGPLPSVPAMRRGELSLKPSVDISSRGSLSFWLFIDQTYRAGSNGSEIHERFLSAPGGFEIQTQLTANSFGLHWDWDGLPSRSSRTLLPGIPGPAWYHVAFEWDSARGTFNGYLNGTPLQAVGTPPGDPWKAKPIETLRLQLNRYGIAGLRLRPELLAEAGLRREVTALYAGSLDHLLGARELGRVDLDTRKGEVLRAYDSPRAADGWVMEGPGELTVRDGWTQVRSKRPEGPNGHLVYWCPFDLPDSYIAEWEIQLLNDEGLCIAFFAARGRQGQDIFDPSLPAREGIFNRYHSGDIDCYHISYYANNAGAPGRITSNLRKNQGFHLVANGPPGLKHRSRDIHRVQLIKDSGHIQLAVDGRGVIGFQDDGKTFGPVLGGGKFGLRQMQSMEAQYRGIRFFQVRDR